MPLPATTRGVSGGASRVSGRPERYPGAGCRSRLPLGVCWVACSGPAEPVALCVRPDSLWVTVGMDSTQWSAVADALRGAGYPANRQDLLNHARQQTADDRTLELITALPIGIYRNLVDVRDRLRAVAT